MPLPWHLQHNTLYSLIDYFWSFFLDLKGETEKSYEWSPINHDK